MCDLQTVESFLMAVLPQSKLDASVGSKHEEQLMGLTKVDLELTQVQLDRLNAAVAARLDKFYREHPDVDPPDAMSVTFTFVFGFGREVDVRVGGFEVPFSVDE